MMKRILSKTLVFLLAFLMVFSCLGTAAFAAPVEAEDETDQEQQDTRLSSIRELMDSLEYADYRALYTSAQNGTETIVLKAEDYLREKSTEGIYLEDDFYQSGAPVILTDEDANPSWKFTVSAAGNYHISITYCPVVSYDANRNGVIKREDGDLTSNTAAIKRAILLDGTYPFKQSRYIELARIWEDLRGGEGSDDERGFIKDNDGNEIKPNKQETPEWRTAVAEDSTGYVTSPFLYYLSEGEHELTLSSVQEAAAIREITISYLPDSISYDEYLARNNAKADQAAGQEPLFVEAELAHRTSSNIIYPVYDRSSAVTSPQSASNIKLNSIGGEKWQTVGNWISWKITVPADGYYNIVPRFKQSFAEGMYVTRSLKIDGELPFTEAKFLQFTYADEWQLAALTDGVKDESGKSRALKFYLTAGEHEIEMCVALGNMASVLTEIELSLSQINEYYLQILMITGSSPDENRDYYFSRLMPDVIKGLGVEAERLFRFSAELEAINGTKGSDSITLENIGILLEKMSNDEDLIAASFSELKDNIGSLGTWIMTARNQPLEFDYILFAPAEDVASAGQQKYLKQKNYEAEAGFWSALVYEFQQFMMSWISDYSSYGVRVAEGTEGYKSIEVWTTSGRDQSTIMRNIVSDSFTPKHNIAVDLKLVAGGALLPATLSGTGPDINLTLASGSVINYAIRSAILPVNPEGYVIEEGDSEEVIAMKKERQEIFADYDQVIAAFADAATIPLELYGVAYGLPETESFSMLFYRSDILLQLGLEIPESWDDVYNMLPTLQTNNLDFGFQNSLAGLLILLYQNGESLYKGHNSNHYGIDPDGNFDRTYGYAINLDSNASLETFKELCELYTMYGFPYSYDFANRFRTGEMPVAVSPYTSYSQLTIFAPELRGLWGFTKLPGTIQVDSHGNVIVGEDGKPVIDHTADTSVAGICMMKDCENIAEAWEFMKWWVSAETQANYGQEYYALLGASGQYATANREALFGMSWTADERKELEEQFDWLRATPELPGGYIISRYVEFAFLGAYTDDKDPVESMLEYIDAINSELTRKRNEFDLPSLDNYEEYLAEITQ